MDSQLSRRTLLSASALALTAGLAACSTGPTSGDSAGQSAEATAQDAASQPTAAFPRTVRHVYGETVIEAQPKRVATVSWVNHDVALALGVVPVGMAAVEYGGNANNSTDWIDARLAELGAELPEQYSEADGINFTGVSAVTPDLILAAYSGITQEEYDKLSKIAPVVAFPEDSIAYGTSWQDSTTLIGEALGLDQEAADLVAGVEAQMAEAAANYPGIAGKTFIYGAIDPAAAEQIYLYTEVDNRPRFLTQLGMEQAPVVTENATTEDGFYITWSPERADELQSDVLVTYAADESVGEAIKSDPLLGAIPAVRNGSMVLQSDAHEILSISAASCLSIPWALENVFPAIAEVAEQAGQ